MTPSPCPDGHPMTATTTLLWGQLSVQVWSALAHQTHQPRGEEVTGNHQPQAPVPAFFTGVEEDDSPEGVEQDEGHGEERWGKRATQTPSDLTTAFLLLTSVKGHAPGLDSGSNRCCRSTPDTSPRPVVCAGPQPHQM